MTLSNPVSRAYEDRAVTPSNPGSPRTPYPQGHKENHCPQLLPVGMENSVSLVPAKVQDCLREGHTCIVTWPVTCGYVLPVSHDPSWMSQAPNASPFPRYEGPLP